MGQKTHPVGFRLAVNKNWRSNWFAKKSMAENLEEDVNIRKYLAYRLPNAGVSRVEISRSSKVATVTIYTARPGIVIGKGGEEVGRLKEEIKQLSKTTDVQINISEVKRPELDSALVGANIAHQLIKKISYRRVVNKELNEHTQKALQNTSSH
jgi:small subunit ribosomal protein S3